MHSIIIDENQAERIYGMTSEYPYVMHTTEMRHYRVPWHWHEELELTYVVRGGLKLLTENAEYHVHEGEVAFTNSNVLETVMNLDERTTAVQEAHIFHPMFLAGHFHSIFDTKYLKPVTGNRQIEVLVITKETERGQKICRMVRDLGVLQKQKDVEFETRNLLSEIWLLLLAEIREELRSRPSASVPGQERIRHMISYIHRYFGEKISLADIADSAGISEREALRTFRKMLNQTPVDYLNDYRMSQACERLASTDETITEIALSCGFSDSAYFSRQFKKAYQINPAAYRKDRQAARETQSTAT